MACPKYPISTLSMRSSNQPMIAYITTIVRVLRAGTYHRMNGELVKAITDSVVSAKRKLG